MLRPTAKKGTMRSTCFVVAAAALSCADAFCVSPRMSGDVLAPFQAGKALKVRCTAELRTLLHFDS